MSLMETETAIAVKPRVLKAENRVPRWVMPLIKTGVIGVDACLAAVSLFFAFSFREGEPIFSSTAWAWSKEFVPYAGILYFAIPVRIAMLVYERAYNYQGAFAYSREL